MRSWIRRFSGFVLVAFCVAIAPAPVQARAKKKQAAALTRRAIKLYKRAEYQRAAALFLEAYELSKRPAQLRNAAKSYQEADDIDAAEPLWRRYLDLPGLSVDERNEAKAHLATIGERKKNAKMRETAEDLRAAAERAREEAEAARIAAEAAASAPRNNNTARVTVDETHAAPVGGYVLFGAGAGVLAAGAVLWFVASGELASVDERLAMRNNQGRIVGIGPAELDSELQSINTKRVISGLLVAAGVVSAAGGITWLLIDTADEPTATVSIAPTRGGAQLGVVGRF
ncbi:MAG: hypothetical protein RMA76_02480 [Deltaproteobacteria bacterium]|jgi:tetratricopeptide (TPR) repeat protein